LTLQKHFLQAALNTNPTLINQCMPFNQSLPIFTQIRPMKISVQL
jgi:hypothetical protein